MNRDDVITALTGCLDCTRSLKSPIVNISIPTAETILELLKEQEKKRITLQKKHVITWSRSDEFSMRKLYEAICETLLDEGELFIARTDNHEKVEFVFYVEEGR